MLRDYIDDGGWVINNYRFANDIGTPIVSVIGSSNGQLISDEYILTLSAVAGGTTTVTVQTGSPNNPYNGRVVTGVVLDDVTAVTNVVPGLSIVFNDTAANGNEATVYAGSYLGVFDASGVEAGVPSDGVRHRVVNTSSTSPVSNAKATLLTQAVAVKKTGTVFAYSRPFASGATEKTAGGGSSQTMPYALKAITVSGSGGSKTCSLQVDGVTLGADTILDTATGLTQAGTLLKAIDNYAYRIIDGPLEGFEFAIAAAVATNDICNVLIFPSRFIQIAPDVSGVEGTYGVVDVPLTEAGQTEGIILPEGEAFYWARTLVPIGGVAESNPYPSNIVLQSSETSSAGWTV